MPILGCDINIIKQETLADLSRENTRGSAIGTLGSIMDIGHTTGPIVAGIIASSFGIGYSFIGAAIMLTVIAFVFLTGVMIRRSSQIT